MKIVMADPPVIRGRYRTNMPNLGILYLISYLRKNFDNLEVHYLEGFLSLEQHIKKLKEIGPDIYAISFATLLSDAAYQTTKVMRNEFPTLPIICGGAHPTAAPEEVLTSSQVDVCVIGEGEVTLTELVGYYMNSSKQLGDIRGIAYKKSGEVICTPPRPLIENIDSIPFPAWDVFDLKNYHGETLVKARPHMMVIVSRGCAFNCNFCSNPVWKASKPWHRPRSPENIAAEVELLYKMGVRDIRLRCDEFNVVPDWSIEVCNEISKLGHRDLYLSTLLRVDKVTDELAKALNGINCWYVSIGIESGNQRTLDGINKQITLDQVVNACKILKRYDIKIFGFFMMFNIWEEDGELCYESPEDVMTTLKFAHTLLSNKLIDLMSWGFVVPLLGATLYDICQRHNLIMKDARGLVSKWGGSPVKLPGIEEKVMQRLKREGMRLQIRYALFNAIRYINWRDWRYLLNKIGFIFRK